MNDYIQKNAHRITYSKLKDFQFCPQYYNLKYVQKVVPDSESDALIFGSAFDLYIRDTEEFGQKYITVAVRNNNVEDKLAEAEAKASEAKTLKQKTDAMMKVKQLKSMVGKTQLTSTMGAKMSKCMDELKRHPLFKFNPKNAQVSVEVQYKGVTIGGTMDELDLEEGIIADNKTAGSVDKFMMRSWQGESYVDRYKGQLAFYQLLVQLKHDILCHGKLNIVSSEDDPKAEFYWADKQSLLDHRATIMQKLDEMIEAINIGIYSSSPREKCKMCDAYRVCSYSIQDSFIQI